MTSIRHCCSDRNTFFSLSWPVTPKLKLAEGDEVQTFGKRKTLQGSAFSHHKTMQKINYLNLISLFEHKLDNNFGTEGVLKVFPHKVNSNLRALNYNNIYVCKSLWLFSIVTTPMNLLLFFNPHNAYPLVTPK